MKLKKPNFWDYKKPNIFALLHWPITLILKLNNILKIKKKIKFENIKTICVGNIYIGGTGKTSLAIKLKKILEKKNLKICFVKKFYKDQIDEQKLLEKHGKLFVKKNRIHALEEAIKDKYDVAIFDDGLQDRSINYDLSFVCFNSYNWIGNGFLIPAGPLRESINVLKRQNNIVLNGYDDDITDIKKQIKKINPKANIYEAKYIHLNNDNFDKNKKYIVFSGIGNHKTFLNMLKKQKFDILKDFEFPDHYNYTKADLNKIFNYSREMGAKIITTEKDFLRLNNIRTDNIEFIKSDLEILDKEEIIKTIIN